MKTRLAVENDLFWKTANPEKKVLVKKYNCFWKVGTLKSGSSEKVGHSKANLTQKVAVPQYFV